MISTMKNLISLPALDALKKGDPEWVRYKDDGGATDFFAKEMAAEDYRKLVLEGQPHNTFGHSVRNYIDNPTADVSFNAVKRASVM